LARYIQGGGEWDIELLHLSELSSALSTPGGDVEIGIPKLRQGNFFPGLSEPRRPIDKALWAVIMTAYITFTSTR
jgi:transposase-like protein